MKPLAKLARLVPAVAALAAVTAATSTAHATNLVCTPIQTEFASGYVIVQCPGIVNYYGTMNPPTGCSQFTQSLDTIKVWSSMAQAAVVGGKSVQVWFTSCGGENLLFALDLNNH